MGGSKEIKVGRLYRAKANLYAATNNEECYVDRDEVLLLVNWNGRDTFLFLLGEVKYKIYIPPEQFTQFLTHLQDFDQC